MRNLLKSFAVIAVALSFVACKKEMEGSKDEPKVFHKVTFVADTPETKTSATVDGSVVNYTWKETDATMTGEVDKFHVFENGVAADEVLANLESDGTMTITAMFSGEYPTEGTIYTGYFNTGVQAVQEADGTDYDQLSDVLIARATAANAEGYIPFQFKRLGAICEMNIKGLTAGTNLKRVIVEATDENVFLAGSLVDGELVGNSKSIVINSLNEITSGVAKIRFVSLPVEGANLKVTVETTEDSETVSGTFYKKFAKAISFTEGDLKAFNVATAQVSKGDMWDYEFTDGVFTEVNQTKTLSEIDWTVSGTGNTGKGYFQKDGNNRGEQFGSSGNPFTTLTFSSEDFGESYFVKDIRVTATSGATPVALTVSVGGVVLKNGENTSASLSTTENTYVFDADYLLSGKIELTFNQTASTKKAMYVHEIAVNYVARCEAPVANVESGSEVVGGSKIELSSETEGASIYYTLDGETPTVESALYNSTDKVTMPNNDCTLKAIAVKDNMANSTVAEFTYTLPTVANPKLSFKSGKIVASCATENAVIRYKIGGEDVADPTESDSVYDDDNRPSISANSYASIKAFKAGYHESQAVKAQYVAGAGLIDIIDAEATSVGGVSNKGTSTWVTDFDITETVSGAVYRIHTMGTGETGDALRFNNNGFLNTTTSGGVAKKITITGAAKTYNIYGGSSSFGTSKPSGTASGTLRVSNGTGSFEFTSEYEYIAIVGTESSSTITSITIEWGKPKANRDLAFFNGGVKVNATLNATYPTFTAPTLKDGETVISSGVTYSSNNQSVATVDENTGAVTLHKHGTAEITANVAADETHKAGSASYTINVAHVLSGISLADDSAQPTEFYQNTAFNYTGIKVNANYNDDCVVDITSQLTSANFSGYDMATTGEQTVTITYEGKTTSYTLNVLERTTHSVNVTANNHATITASPLENVEVGTKVTLGYSNVETGYGFVSFSVLDADESNVTVTENAGVYSFIMPAKNVTVSATFAKVKYDVTVPTSGLPTGCSVSVDKAKAEYGENVTLTFNPATGYKVNILKMNGGDELVESISNNNQYSFTMPASNVTFAVTFGKIAYNVTRASMSNGTVLINSSDNNTTANYNEDITITAQPESDDYRLKAGTLKAYLASDVNKTALKLTSGTTFKMPAGDVEVYAEFEERPNTSTAVYTVNTTTSVTTSGVTPTGSSATFKNTYTSSAKQLTEGKSMTLTLGGYQGKIVKSVVLSMRSNGGAGAGYLSIKAGSTTLGSIGSSGSGVAFNNPSWNGAYTTDYTDVTPTLSNIAYSIKKGEDLVIVIGATTNSLYCQRISVEYADDPSYVETYAISLTQPSGGKIEAKVNGSAVTSAVANATVTLNVVTTPTGKTFSAWKVVKKSGGEVTVTGNTFTMPADDVTVSAVFTGGGSGEETISLASGEGSGDPYSITWSGDSCTIKQSKGSGAAVSSSYISAPRWYQNNVISFKAKSGYTVTKVEVVCTTAAYATALANSSNSASVNKSKNTQVDITLSDDLDITMGAQARISSIKVYYEN